MNPRDETFSERAPGTKHGPLYVRSSSLHKVKKPTRIPVRPAVFNRVETTEGHLSFHRDDPRYCIQSTREYAPCIKGIFLEKALVEDEYSGHSKPNEKFYPLLWKMFQKQLAWDPDFHTGGLAGFMPLLMEWTQHVMKRYEKVLKQADIYGLTAISQYPYLINPEVWRAFCELWGPLTNTLLHGGGEVGLSLNDMKHIGGLSIVGDPYEEYIPTNKNLSNGKRYPPTVSELLRAHADICESLKAVEVTWEEWLSYFYREKQIYAAFGDESASGVGRKPRIASKNKLDSLPPPSTRSKGELASFLALLLSRFLLPHGSAVVRPETFVMACLMSEGRKISLAPTVLGHIYHGMNHIANFSNPGSVKARFGIHFVIGWLGEYFPSLYRGREADEFPKEYPRLVYYAGVQGRNLSIHQARFIFRDPSYVIRRSIPFGEVKGLKDIHVDKATPVNFERILCLRSCVLWVRVGSDIFLEPHYVNRTSRQFGFDQSIPSNSLNFPTAMRSGRSLEDVAYYSSLFFSRKSGPSYCIPRSGGQGICTWSYCSWWVEISTPFLSQTLNQINVLLVNKDIEPHLKPDMYIVSKLIQRAKGLKGPIKISDFQQAPIPSKDLIHLPNKSFESITNENIPCVAQPSTAKRVSRERSPSEDVNFKRLRYDRSARSDGSTTADLRRIEPGVIAHESDTVVVDVESMPPTSGQRILIDLDEDPPILFLGPVPDFIRRVFVDGVKSIVATFSTLESPSAQLATRLEILQILDALKNMAGVQNVNKAGVDWISFRVHAFLEGVEVLTQLEGEIAIISSTDVSLLEGELESHKVELSQLQEKALTMKARQKEVADMKAKYVEMLKSYTDDKDKLEQDTIKVEERIKNKEVEKLSLQEATTSSQLKIDEVKQQKKNLDSIVAALTSITSSG